MRTKRKRTKGAVSWVTFNINDHVCVRLNRFGRECLRKNYEALWADSRCVNAPAYTPPQEDAGGWSRWQAWQLMQDFGRHIAIGAPMPFDTTIRIEKANLSQIWHNY